MSQTNMQYETMFHPLQNVLMRPAIPHRYISSTLFVGDLDLGVEDSQLNNLFSWVRVPVSSWVARDITNGRSLRHGYVIYENSELASAALDMLNYSYLNGKQIRIMRYCTTPESSMDIESNIFVNNLDDSIDSRALHEIFLAFGNVLSCKVDVLPTGESKGQGYVQFDNKESALKAVAKMNGYLINKKPVYVGPFIARKRIQPHAGPPPPLRPVPQALKHEWYPQMQPCMQMPPMIPQSMAPWDQIYGNGYASTSGYGMHNGSVTRFAGGVIPSEPTNQQLQKLGDSLYALIEKLKPGAGPKITGMFLENEESEILQLLQSPELLRAKVDEAMTVLRNIEQ